MSRDSRSTSPGTTRPGALTRPDLLLLAVVAVASLTAVSGFSAVFVDWSFLPAAIAGAVLGTSIVALGWKFRLLIGESIALSIVAFVVVGVVVAGPVPGADSLRTLIDAMTGGWADILSLTPPTDVTAEFRVLPFSLAWAGATIGGELLRRTTAPGLAVVGPLIALAVSVLVTDEDRTVATLQGAVTAISALVIGFSQFMRHANRTTTLADTEHATADAAPDAISDTTMQPADGSSRPRLLRNFLRAGVALVVIAVAAPLLGPHLPFAEAYERFDLRDRNEPPWDPLLVASPLVELKEELKGTRQSEIVLTVQSDEPIERFNVAVLGDYTGVVWAAGSASNVDAVSEFRPVGTSLPGPPEPSVDAPDSRATITIGELRGPWLPQPAGWPVEANFAAAPGTDGDDDVGSDLRMNLITGTLALPSGISPGLTYDITFHNPPAVDPTVLVDAPFTPLLPSDEDDLVPPQIQNVAADIVEGADRGWPQVAAIRDSFVDDGFYDTSSESRPGHALYRVLQFIEDTDKIVGYEEQYAATAAILARSAQLPTRLVVGYLIPPERYDDAGIAEVRADDISAWIEVDFGTLGWVPVDVTPDRSREPVDEATGVTVKDIATPSPPPPPADPPRLEVLASEDEPDEEEEDEEEDQDEDDSVTSTGIATLVGGAAGGIAGVALLAAVVIVAWKAARRRRRRRVQQPALQVGYAWREVLDRYQEAGLAVPDRSTPGEVVRTFQQSELTDPEASGDLRSLAIVVQRSAFHADEPEHTDGEAAWNYHDDVVSHLRHRLPFVQRLRMKVDPRTLQSSSWRRLTQPSGGDDR